MSNQGLTTQQKYEIYRAKMKIKRSLISDAQFHKELDRMYKDTLSEIDMIIDEFVTKYSKDNKISKADVYKAISKLDMERFERLAKKYVIEKNFSRKANHEMELYNLTMKVNRLELLARRIELETIVASNYEEQMLKEKLLSEGMKELEKMSGILGIPVPSKTLIESMVLTTMYESYHNTDFSDKIWINNKAVRARLNIGVHRSIMQGVHSETWAKNLKGLVKDTITGKAGASYNAKRLASTELSRVENQISFHLYKEGGFGKYRYVTEPGCCPICKKLTNKIINIEDGIEGINIPPLHPWCRCRTIAYEDEEE